jgi:hypothetical protein
LMEFSAEKKVHIIPVFSYEVSKISLHKIIWMRDFLNIN